MVTAQGPGQAAVGEAMSRSNLAAAIATLSAQLERPRFVRVVATLLVHARAPVPGAARCPCCASRDAAIVEERVVADVVIDTVTGERITAATCAAERWAGVVEIAERHEVPLRCSTKTLPLLLDDSGRGIFAAGGHRSSKTTTGLTWLALQIIERGGVERRFWLVGQTDEKAFRLLAKLFASTPSPSGGSVAPILPAALVARAPATHRASNL